MFGFSTGVTPPTHTPSPWRGWRQAYIPHSRSRGAQQLTQRASKPRGVGRLPFGNLLARMGSWHAYQLPHFDNTDQMVSGHAMMCVAKWALAHSVACVRGVHIVLLPRDKGLTRAKETQDASHPQPKHRNLRWSCVRAWN